MLTLKYDLTFETLILLQRLYLPPDFLKKGNIWHVSPDVNFGGKSSETLNRNAMFLFEGVLLSQGLNFATTWCPVRGYCYFVSYFSVCWPGLVVRNILGSAHLGKNSSCWTAEWFVSMLLGNSGCVLPQFLLGLKGCWSGFDCICRQKQSSAG